MAVLEQALEHAIVSVLDRDPLETHMKLFNSDSGVRRDLNAKIVIAYVLGIIGENTLDDLKLMRQIRNVFAHSRAVVDFDTAELLESANMISIFDRMGPESKVFVEDNPRRLFFNSAFEISLWLFTFDISKEDSWGRKILQS